jgi:hypothetical protein
MVVDRVLERGSGRCPLRDDGWWIHYGRPGDLGTEVRLLNQLELNCAFLFECCVKLSSELLLSLESAGPL